MLGKLNGGIHFSLAKKNRISASKSDTVKAKGVADLFKKKEEAKCIN